MSGRRNFTMDDEAEDLLDAHAEDNHSELVRELLKEYYTPGVFDTQEAALNVREQRLEARLDAIRTEADAVQSELSALRDARDGAVASTDEKTKDALRTCASLDEEDRREDNPAVQRQAERTGLDVETFLDRLAEQYPTDSLGNGVRVD